MSRDFFRDHYEAIHVATALPVLAGLVGYERQHVRAEILGAPGFDCMTIFDWRDAAAAGAAFERSEGPAGEAIRRDERLFMDKPANVFFAVESGEPWRTGEPSGARARLLLCLRRPAGDTPVAFRGRCERDLLPALRTAVKGARWCRPHWGAAGAAFDAVVELACDAPGDLAAWSRTVEAAGAEVLGARVSVHDTKLDG